MQKFDLPLTRNGSIFQIDQAFYTTSDNANGTFTLIVHNKSGDWVDTNVDRSLGVAPTGHIPNGSNGGFTEPVGLYASDADSPNKITRWRPGFMGVAGNGGGEILFWWPAGVVRAAGGATGLDSMLVEITVTG